MKTILSFLKPVGKGLDWVRQRLIAIWRFNRPSFFPTEKNLLLSFWYDFVYFKSRRPGATALSFLDARVVYIKRIFKYPDRPLKTRLLYRDLFNALHNPRLRMIIIQFLESSPPEDHYLPVLEAMRCAWRDDGQQQTVLAETQEVKVSEQRHEPPEQPDAPLAGPEASQPSEPSEESKEDDPPGDAPRFNAKTYFIAAELHYELAGRQDEFQVLCRQLPELAAFVQREFGAGRLPGRFKEFKGYTYKKALKDHNTSIKGQLKTPFHQIINNPQVFGEAIAGRASEILAEHFN